MFAAAAAALLVAMVMALIRLYAGPSLYDRVLAANAFGTKTVLLIAVMGFLTGRPDFLDIALLYALLNFIATIAVLKFFRYRTLGDGLDGPLELTDVFVKHGEAVVFTARFNPPLPDLRWPLDRPYTSRVMAGAHTSDDSMVGAITLTPTDAGVTVDLIPERHAWACQWSVRTTITLGADVTLSAVIATTLAAGGAGPDGCAALP